MNVKNSVLQPAFAVWLKLQSGPEMIIRFGDYVNNPAFGARIRHQNGHEHCCSVGFLSDFYLIKIRKICQLDEALIGRCFRVHDIPEGIIELDVAAPIKTDQDDLREYLTFESLMKPLGSQMWAEQQKAFLLQFCLKNPACFPKDARKIMSKLARTKKNEALFFDGVQRLDYVFYAYECHANHDATMVLEEVLGDQFPKLENIRKQFPEFGKVAWTAQKRKFFSQFLKKSAVA